MAKGGVLPSFFNAGRRRYRSSSRDRRRYASAYQGTSAQDEPGCWAYTIMFCGGALAIGWGLMLLITAARGQREVAIAAFASTISNWTDYRRELERTNFSLGVRMGAASAPLRPATLWLPEDDKFDIPGEPDQESGLDLPDYHPLKYYSPTTPHRLLPTLNFTMPPEDDAIFEITASYRPMGGGGGAAKGSSSSSRGAPIVSTLVLPKALPLWTKRSVSGATPVPERKCPEQQHGVYVGHMCEIYARLASVCVAVDLNRATGEWFLSPRHASKPEGVGCEKGHTSATVSAHALSSNGQQWNPARYKNIQPTYDGHGVYRFPETTLDDVQMTVRSAHDPYIEAEKATRGSHDFGWSRSTALIVGSILLVVGLCMCFAPAYAFWQCYKEYEEDQRLDPENQRYTAVREFGVNTHGDVEMVGSRTNQNLGDDDNNQLGIESDDDDNDVYSDSSGADTVSAMHSSTSSGGLRGEEQGGEMGATLHRGGSTELAGGAKKSSTNGRGGSLIGRRPSPPQERKV